MKRKMMRLMACVLLVTMLSGMGITASAKVYKIMKVVAVNNKSALRLRSKHDMSVIKKPSLKVGSKVLYLGKTKGGMYLVRTTSGREGYVYGKCLRPYGAIDSKQIYKTNRATAACKKAGGSYKFGLGSGKYVYVYEMLGDWAYVKTPEGKTGYVKVAHLDKAG